MSRRRHHKTTWQILRDAGLILIVILGIGLLGAALGLAFGMRLI